jgi:hypothetical protein
MSRTVKPTDIKTLQDWVKRWPKASNLSFDKDTREATIYNDKTRSKSGSIPWKREGDVITVLTQPKRFSADVVTAAVARIEKPALQNTDELLSLEKTMLAAWRSYKAAPSRPLMLEVLAAEKALNDMERASAPEGRVVVKLGDYLTAYVPPLLPKERGLALAL